MPLNISIHTAQECLRVAHILQGHATALQAEKSLTVKKVEGAKKWLARQPQYLSFLQNLQKALHQQNIGAFSELLSYFVKDVLKKDKEIVLDLYTYHNLPALKIEALNDGCRESIYEGNGGSIANIVSTGLRLIALSRLSHRKFIVLDEPDCWLKPDHVPTFAKIIGEISEKLKIQTIIISHHDWKYFKDYGRVIELSTDGKNLNATLVHDTAVSLKGDEDIIESIRLRQFMSHYDTIFELHPYLTCLIGENDIGKSVLTTALKAVSYNDSSDSYIQHHTDEAQVLVSLSRARQVLWQRFKVTTQDNPQKVKYSLFTHGGLVASEFNSHDVPRFIAKELNIVTTEDIDIHIGNQKQPVFLLSSDVKPQERAKILSLGKESLIIQKMMENIKVKTRQNKHSVKEGEERFDLLSKQLLVLDDIDSLVQMAQEAKSCFAELATQETNIEELRQSLLQYGYFNDLSEVGMIHDHVQPPLLKDDSHLQDMLHAMTRLLSVMELAPVEHELPGVELHQTTELEKLLARMNLCQQGINVGHIALQDITVELHDVEALSTLIMQLHACELANACELVEHRDTSMKLHPVGELESFIASLTQGEQEINHLLEQRSTHAARQELVEQEVQDFLKENNHICPTCHQPITAQHIGDIHA